MLKKLLLSKSVAKEMQNKVFISINCLFFSSISFQLISNLKVFKASFTDFKIRKIRQSGKIEKQCGIFKGLMFPIFGEWNFKTRV